MSATDRTWYCLRAHAGRALEAADQLRRQRYEAWAPSDMREIRQHRGPAVRRAIPIFGPYLFAGLVVGEQAFAPILSTIGIAAAVCFGTGPEPITGAHMGRIMAAVEQHRALIAATLLAGREVFVIGEIVRATWAGHELPGEILNDDGGPTVEVALDIFGRRVPTSVPVAAVRRVEAEPARRAVAVQGATSPSCRRSSATAA